MRQVTKYTYMSRREKRLNIRVRNVENYANDTMTKKMNEYGDTETWCSFHAMFTAVDQERNARSMGYTLRKLRGQEKEADIRFCLKVMLCF